MADSSRKRKQTDIQEFAVVKKFIHSTPTKDSSLMQDKKDSVSLSSYKFVYARTEDPADTIVLRSISPDCLESLLCYGTKEKKNNTFIVGCSQANWNYVCRGNLVEDQISHLSTNQRMF